MKIGIAALALIAGSVLLSGCVTDGVIGPFSAYSASKTKADVQSSYASAQYRHMLATTSGENPPPLTFVPLQGGGMIRIDILRLGELNPFDVKPGRQWWAMAADAALYGTAAYVAEEQGWFSSSSSQDSASHTINISNSEDIDVHVGDTTRSADGDGNEF